MESVMQHNEPEPAVAPASSAPLWTEAEFATELRELVRDCTPRLFALVEEAGVRADGWVFAWGLAFPEHTYLVRDGGGYTHVRPSPEEAFAVFSRRRKLHLVWCEEAVAAG